MNRFLFLVFFLLFCEVFAFGQPGNDSGIISRSNSVVQQDSAIHQDSIVILPVQDSIYRRLHKDSGWSYAPATPFSNRELSFQILQHHPYFKFSAPPLIMHSDIRQFHGNELLFYVIVSLLIIYALLRRIFSKYFNDLFRLFFRTTLKQLQLKEQLMQTPLPSLLLNIFFVISGGLYISFLLEYGQLIPGVDFWQKLIYSVAGLTILYFVKFLGLKVSGWVFNMKEAADSYIFVVFIINKMIGVLLLPFLVLLAYTQGNVYYVSITLSWLVVIGLLIYRFILTYGVVRKQVKVNPFHFFLYLCAFEIAPLLLIYKGLLLFFHITT